MATDNWAVIGTNRKTIAEKAKSITEDSMYEKDIDDFVNAPKIKEASNTRNRKGIVVDYNTRFQSASLNKAAFSDAAEETSLTVLHGAGHSTRIVQEAGGHLKYGIMQEGNALGNEYRQLGTKSILNDRQSGRGGLLEVRYDWGNDL